MGQATQRFEGDAGRTHWDICWPCMSLRPTNRTARRSSSWPSRYIRSPVQAQGFAVALTMPRVQDLTSSYFVRCELCGPINTKIVDNEYWQSTTLDDLGPLSNDSAFSLKQVSWANFTALNAMTKVSVKITGTLHAVGGEDSFAITLRNPSKHIAFFERAAVTAGKDGDEILPVIYSDNYVTLFPGETTIMRGHFRTAELSGKQPWLRLEGYNITKELGRLR